MSDKSHAHGEGESHSGIEPNPYRTPSRESGPQIRQKLRERLHEKTKGTTEWLQAVVRGYFQYHAVPWNEERLKAFRHEVLHMWWWQLRRRSQRSRWTWEQFQEKLGHLIPEVEILHPYPEVRFASKHPR